MNAMDESKATGQLIARTGGTDEHGTFGEAIEVHSPKELVSLLVHGGLTVTSGVRNNGECWVLIEQDGTRILYADRNLDTGKMHVRRGAGRKGKSND